MIEISKSERNYLEKNGCKFNVDIHKSHSKHPKMYLVESEKNLRAIEEYRKNTVVYTKA